MQLAPPQILERESELGLLDRLAVEAARGEGALALIEGPPGIGKTALAAAARDGAAAHGLTVLGAVSSQLDSDFPFGVVHQLLGGMLASADPERRERLLGGAASFARLVLAPEPSVEPAVDPSHTALHGLYWLCANLAEEGPLLLLVDDLQWADPPSLRFLEFLGRRLEGLPVLVLATARTGAEQGAEELLAALAAGPAARAIRPVALSEAATARLVGEGLDTEPEAEFVRACHEATGGVPLLLRELVRSARDRGLAGSAQEAARVPELGGGELATVVQRRLASLGPEAGAVAQAVAVVGDRARLDDLAALAEVPPESAAAALDALARADVLARGRPVFVHPLVREAVLSSLGAAARRRAHATMARRLADRAAAAAEVAVHLLAADPAGEAWVTGVLRGAAESAALEGATDTAVALLRRALDEPPPAAERADVLLALGELEAARGEGEALERLEAALEAGLEGDAAVRARVAGARILLLTDPQRAIDELTAVRDLPGDPKLALTIESMLLDATAYDRGLEPRRAALLAEARRQPEPSPVALAHMAMDDAYRGGDAQSAVDLARRALDSDALLRAVGPQSGTYHLLSLTLRHAERADLAEIALERAEAEARRQGLGAALMPLGHARAYWNWYFGSVAAAEAHARAGLELARAGRVVLFEFSVTSLLAEILLERDAAEEAATLLAQSPLTPVTDRSITGPDHLSVRALLHRAAGRAEEAEADLRAALEHLRARGWRTPLKARAGLRLAELLGEADRAGEALELLDEAEAVARGAGTDGAVGVALRIRGRVLGGEEGVAALREAVTALHRSPLRLERAWANHDLGALIRRTGRRAEARDPLRVALDEADRIGAVRLAGLAREELLASGARPARTALTGSESLTPSERRIAELAASGLTNRQIAESLWVTRKTVEVHLGHAYGKLGIRSRAQLAEALE